MKITLKVKLMTTDEQARILLETMESFNKACDWISEKAFEDKVFNAYDLHYLLYKEGREFFPSLPSQLMIRAISKVSDSYKTERKKRHFFRDRSAMEYDKRTISFKDLSQASLATVRGRIKVPLVFGYYAPLDRNKMLGQADLTYSKGKFFLNLVIDLPDPPPFKPEGPLGVDMGIVHLSTDSEGESFSGKTVDHVRERSTAHKARLQKKGTKSAKRRLKKVSGREARFKKDTNHVISKRIVSKAKGTCQAIVLEDLKGIRDGITVRHGQRERFGKWAYGQLRSFILYKATRSGVPVLFVDPRNTSRQCSCCGNVDRKNRKSQSEFQCVQCGFSLSADWNAAINIARRASINTPIAV